MKQVCLLALTVIVLAFECSAAANTEEICEAAAQICSRKLMAATTLALSEVTRLFAWTMAFQSLSVVVKSVSGTSPALLASDDFLGRSRLDKAWPVCPGDGSRTCAYGKPSMRCWVRYPRAIAHGPYRNDWLTADS